MAAFVTGGTGFIGARLVRRLVEDGRVVHLLTREHSDLTGLDDERIRTFRGDVTEPESLRAAVAGCRAVFHLAGYARNYAPDPATYDRINVGGFLNVAEAALAARVERFVFTSTCMTSGPTDGRIATEDAPRDTMRFLTHYERTKFQAEQGGRTLLARGLPLVTLNPTRVYGPGRMTEGNSVARLIDLFLRGKFPAIPGTGREVGNYVHVDDVVDAQVRAAERGRVGEKYYVAGENCSLDAFFALLSELSGRRPPRFHLPRWLVRLYGHEEQLRATLFGRYPLVTPGWVETFLRDWAYSNEKARAELGCTFRPLREGLTETIAWLKAEGTGA